MLRFVDGLSESGLCLNPTSLRGQTRRESAYGIVKVHDDAGTPQKSPQLSIADVSVQRSPTTAENRGFPYTALSVCGGHLNTAVFSKNRALALISGPRCHRYHRIDSKSEPNFVTITKIHIDPTADVRRGRPMWNYPTTGTFEHQYDRTSSIRSGNAEERSE